MNDKKSTKSLFLYTALIFLVALLMIILSFFGQNHADKLRETEMKAQTITERASALSEENLRLTEKVAELDAQIEALNTTVSEEQAKSAQLTEQLNGIENVVAAKKALDEKNKELAAETIKTVNAELLTPHFKEMYDAVMEKVTEE